MPVSEVADIGRHERSEVGPAVSRPVEALPRVESATPRRRVYVGVALVTVGAVFAVYASVGPAALGTTWNGFIGLASLALVWTGAQRLGRVTFGPRFSLGVWASVAWLVVIIVLAVAADWLPIDGIDEPVLDERFARPELGSGEPLGRDAFGRSLLSRTIYGARVSIAVGLLSASLAMVVGVALGLVSGYFRGALDSGTNIVVTTVLAFPPLVFLLALVAVVEPSMTILSVGLAILAMPTFARLTRAQTISLAQREFVIAAQAIGASSRRIVLREILPNVSLPVASYAFLVVAGMIVAEGSLSFVGLGVPPPTPSWGGMIADAQGDFRDHPHLVLVPATAMFLTVLSLNRIGDSARTRLNNRSAKL